MSEPGNGFAYRLSAIERRIERIESLEPAVVKAQMGDLKDDVFELREDMRAVKRALYGLAISIAGGSALFAFTAFQLWGGP